jgi:hypothetical protein
VFAQNPYFRALGGAQRRADVLDQAREGADQLGADWVFITDGAGTVLAKSDAPADTVAAARPDAARRRAARRRGAARAGGHRLRRHPRRGQLFQAGAVPIVVPGDPPVGVLVAAKAVDEPLAP